MSKEVGVSLNPENFVEGGGLLDDVDVIIKSASFRMFDYDGKSPVTVPALCIYFDQGSEEEVVQYWSMGKPTDWQPSKDGKKLIPIGSATGIVKNSNGGIFLASLINAGFPGDRLGDGDISCLDGMEAHVIRTPAPKRAGLATTQKENATILIIDKIIALPGEGKKKGSGGKGAGRGNKPAATTASDDEVAKVATKAIMALLMENDGSLERADLLTDVFQYVTEKHKDGKLAKAATQLAYQDDFLGSEERPWTLKDGVVTSL